MRNILIYYRPLQSVLQRDGKLVEKSMKATATEEEFQSIGRDGVPKPRSVFTRPNMAAKNIKSKKNEPVEEKDQMVSCLSTSITMRFHFYANYTSLTILHKG